MNTKAICVCASNNAYDTRLGTLIAEELRTYGHDALPIIFDEDYNQVLPNIETEIRQRPIFIAVISDAGLQSPGMAFAARFAYYLYRFEDHQGERQYIPVLGSEINGADLWLMLVDIVSIGATDVTPLSLEEAAALVIQRVSEASVLGDIKVTETSFAGLMSQAEILRYEGHYQAAKHVLTLANRAYPAEASGFLALGDLLLRLEDWRGALQAFERVLLIDARQAQAWGGKSIALAGMGSLWYDFARQSGAEATTLAPKDATVSAWCGRSYQRMQDFSAALDAYQHAIALDATNWQAYQGIGDIARLQGNLAEAKHVYAHILHHHTRQPETLYAMALLERDEGNIEQAITLLDQACAIEPEEPQFAKTFAHLLEDSHQTDRALAAFERALQLMPDDADLLSGFGFLLARAGRFREASRVLRQLPYDDMRAAQGWAWLCVHGDQPDVDLIRARTALREIVKRHPAILGFYLALGVGACKMGDFAQAVNDLRQAMNLKPSVAEKYTILQRLAQSFLSLQKNKEAIDALQDLSQMAPQDSSIWQALSEALRKDGKVFQAMGAQRKARQLLQAAKREKPAG